MTNCIEIASWMIAIIGALIFVPSVYSFGLTIIPDPDSYPAGSKETFILIVSTIGVIIGGLICLCGVAPYVPCITVVP